MLAGDAGIQISCRPCASAEGVVHLKRAVKIVAAFFLIGLIGVGSWLLLFPGAEPIALVNQAAPDTGAISTPDGYFYELNGRMIKQLREVLIDNEKLLWQPPSEEMELFATVHLDEDYRIATRGDSYYLQLADGSYAKLDANALQAVFNDPASSYIYGMDEPPSLLLSKETGWSLEPYGYEWVCPRLFDTQYLNSDGAGATIERIELGALSELLPVADDSVRSMTFTLIDEMGEWNFSDLQDLHSFGGSGDYTLRIDCDCGERGKVWYLATLAVGGTPSVTIDQTEAQLGEMLTLTATNVPEGSEITVETNLRYTPIFLGEGSEQVALAPISYFTEPGDGFYIDVAVGELQEHFEITVLDRTFEVQHLTVDSSTVSDTVGSSKATEEFNSTIDPLTKIYDPVQYWEEPFILPIEITPDTNIRVSTEYGLTRYTNGSSNGTRHDGVDLAVKQGTPVLAPNNGRVIFAGYLQMTGNTVLIEHGYGLKSWFYHMDSLSVETGEMVERGQQIGTVGSTGFSTGPHLHLTFSVRQTYLDPFAFIERPEGL